MAMVSHVPVGKTQQASPLRLVECRMPGKMASGREIVEETVARVIEEKIFVSVGKSVKECKSMLLWALQNSGGKRICVIHVHQPAQMIPFMGTKFQASKLKEQEVRAYWEIERQEMLKMLDEYRFLCRKMGVRAEKQYVEMESIEKGILELISLHGIRKLVMGAAADKRYSKNMMGIKSKKAVSVCLQAPASCHIWFICKGHLIQTRKGALDGTDTDVRSSSQQKSPNTEAGQSNIMRSQSIFFGQHHHVKLTNPAQDLFRKVRFLNVNGPGGRLTTPTSPDGGPSTPLRSDADGSSDQYDALSRSTSQNSVLSSSSSSGTASVALIIEGSEIGSELSTVPHQKEDLFQSSPPSVLDGSIEDPLYDQLEQAMAEAENSRREASEEAVRCAKEERDVVEAIHKAKASESLYTEESKRRTVVEEELAKEKEELEKIDKELEKINKEQDEVMGELCIAQDHKSLLEKQIEVSDEMVKELEQRIISAVGLLQNYKKERDHLHKGRDSALKEAEEMRRNQTEASSTHMPRFFSDFSFSEIEEATHHFDPSCKIGEGGYGNIYKGVLRQTQVAVKMLHSNSMQGPAEFEQEVNVLSKMRHPNLITLVGACPEAWTLIYEYLPNGSLEDRLSCKDNSPPLSWQTRIRIATELCSVLIFLHSSKPHSIVHGDLKPANILLDENFVTKLSDFGICRLLDHKEGSSNNTTICRTDPKGTFVYMDPEFVSTGELSPKSDVYSFGIILLRLLTARQALGITKEVQYALDKGNLKTLLDPLAGDWPFVQAEMLAHVALRCCEMKRKNRPDLASEVWRVLEPMKASCGTSSFPQLGSEEHLQPPSYFICPIFQEVMRDPHVAADGFTYEAEALKGWLDSGHDTSPMTNFKLAHCDLIPNRALRSAIQGQLQQQ
ncbi:PREDICTED: U-box domain-containing protein 33-like isoform X1 [Populus euphratica]|uniref:RING-type E3 ubiquitin transferase n=1 Tax=Populus euphratica TaxID=75702 RepID=A0AAJ6UUJ0_POPEU|nr:PREDICTED: U-box domain-containing protein 33-like isoform X1 [Populus euphratica]